MSCNWPEWMQLDVNCNDKCYVVANNPVELNDRVLASNGDGEACMM